MCKIEPKEMLWYLYDILEKLEHDIRSLEYEVLHKTKEIEKDLNNGHS